IDGAAVRLSQRAVVKDDSVHGLGGGSEEVGILGDSHAMYVGPGETPRGNLGLYLNTVRRDPEGDRTVCPRRKTLHCYLGPPPPVGPGADRCGEGGGPGDRLLDTESEYPDHDRRGPTDASHSGGLEAEDRSCGATEIVSRADDGHLGSARRGKH